MPDRIVTVGNCYSTSAVLVTAYMFKDAYVLDDPVTMDTSSVTDMSVMFLSATSFNQPLAFNTSLVTDMRYMFYDATLFNQLLLWDVGRSRNFMEMFTLTAMLTASSCFVHNHWKGQSAIWNPQVAGMGAGITDAMCAPYLQQLCLPIELVTTLPTGVVLTEEGCYNTSAVTSTAGMFADSAIDYWMWFDTSSVTTMYGMFAGAASFSRDLSALDVSSVTDFGQMFARTRMADQAAAGLHFTRPCQVHATWKAQNPTHWDPQAAGLPASINDAHCAPYLGGELLCSPATRYINTVPVGLVGAGGGCYDTSAVTSTLQMFWGRRRTGRAARARWPGRLATCEVAGEILQSALVFFLISFCQRSPDPV